LPPHSNSATAVCGTAVLRLAAWQPAAACGLASAPGAGLCCTAVRKETFSQLKIEQSTQTITGVVPHLKGYDAAQQT